MQAYMNIYINAYGCITGDNVRIENKKEQIFAGSLAKRPQQETADVFF